MVSPFANRPPDTRWTQQLAAKHGMTCSSVEIAGPTSGFDRSDPATNQWTLPALGSFIEAIDSFIEAIVPALD